MQFFIFHSSFFILSTLAAAAASVEVAGRVWTLGDGATLDGTVATFRVDGVARRSATATTEVDLTPFVEGGGVQWRVRACGSGVAEPAKSYLGLKAMLTYKEADGTMKYPGPPGKSGEFGWYLMRHRAALTNGVAGKATFMVGLQETTGEARFDLATLAFLPVNVEWPQDDPALQCEYSGFLNHEKHETHEISKPRCGDLTPEGQFTAAEGGDLMPEGRFTAAEGGDLMPEGRFNAPQSRSPLRGFMLPSRGLHDEDFAKLASWGVTLVRYQMNRNWNARDSERDLDDYDAWMEVKLAHLEERVLPFAAKYGIKVVVDLHMPPGGKSYDHEMNMFYEPDYADHYVETWRRIARRCAPVVQTTGPVIFAYDLVNEPHQSYAAVGGNDYLSLQVRAAKAIREIDPDTPVCIEALHSDSPEGFKYLSAVPMKDVVYEVHVYQPFAYTHQGVNPKKPWEKGTWPDEEKGWNRDFLREKLAPVREFQLRHGARIYVGEFSCISWAEGAGEYLRDCIALFEEYGWDWTYHAFDEFEGWSIEHESDRPFEFRPSADNPRKRALLEGLAR